MDDCGQRAAHSCNARSREATHHHDCTECVYLGTTGPTDALKEHPTIGHYWCYRGMLDCPPSSSGMGVMHTSISPCRSGFVIPSIAGCARPTRWRSSTGLFRQMAEGCPNGG